MFDDDTSVVVFDAVVVVDDGDWVVDVGVVVFDVVDDEDDDIFDECLKKKLTMNNRFKNSR